MTEPRKKLLISLCNKTNQMHQFRKFTPAWNSTCFGQFLCPLSGVYSLYTRHWCLLHRFVEGFRSRPGWNSVPSWPCSKAVFKPVWRIPLLTVQWINSWWWTDELSEACGVSCWSKFGKLVHLVGFIIKKVEILLKLKLVSKHFKFLHLKFIRKYFKFYVLNICRKNSRRLQSTTVVNLM
jgi:hypothetical protein